MKSVACSAHCVMEPSQVGLGRIR